MKTFSLPLREQKWKLFFMKQRSISCPWPHFSDIYLWYWSQLSSSIQIGTQPLNQFCLWLLKLMSPCNPSSLSSLEREPDMSAGHPRGITVIGNTQRLLCDRRSGSRVQTLNPYVNLPLFTKQQQIQLPFLYLLH